MTRIPADRLERIMHAALAARGVASEHAALVVDGLLTASLRGVDTHGVRLFPTYLAELDGGRSRARPDMTWSSAGAATRRLDAGDALGLVAGMLAAREAVRLSRSHGVGVVSVANSNHFGAASSFAIDMAKADVIGICCSNSDALVAPFQGTSPVFGTNPISIAALAADDDMFCLDMATSQVSFSQVKAWLARGEALPAHWAVKSDGTDAAGARSIAEVPALKALGGYKGHGLAMAISVLCALLADTPLDHELSHFYAEPYDAGRRVSHLFVALDIAAFVALPTFRRRLREYLDHVRAQPAASSLAVRVPGDLEAAARRDRVQHGIPLTPADVAQFERCGLRLDV